MIYTLLQNNFTILSTQTIANIAAKITTHNEQFFKDHKAGTLKLNLKLNDTYLEVEVR